MSKYIQLYITHISYRVYIRSRFTSAKGIHSFWYLFEPTSASYPIGTYYTKLPCTHVVHTNRGQLVVIRSFYMWWTRMPCSVYQAVVGSIALRINTHRWDSFPCWICEKLLFASRRTLHAKVGWRAAGRRVAVEILCALRTLLLSTT